MPVSQQERLAILQDISRDWLELMRAIRGLPDPSFSRPGVVGNWSIKDVLAHVSAWERELIEHIAAEEHGDEWELPNVDQFNAEQAELDADRTLDDVRDDLEETHAELMSILEETPVLSRDLVASDTYKHYAEHAAQITAWRQQQMRRT
jgi:hypothetical protein